METLNENNLLVISDLHLGEDLRPAGNPIAHLRHLVRLERELIGFLAHYTTERLSNRPWTLVVNGDMMDFMSVVILPEEAEVFHDEERRFGLGFGERASAIKLQRIIDRHPQIFEQLAKFIAAGNELVIVIGNHDVEFHYPTVQTLFRRTLIDLAFGEDGSDDHRELFAARMTFCPWFYYLEKTIYIEHGHQYDEYCSFDYFLHPVAPARRKRRTTQQGEIAYSVAHAGMRYFVNQLPNYDPRHAEEWNLFHYLKWAWAQGLRGAIRLFQLYGFLVWNTVKLWYRLLHRKMDRERKKFHVSRLRELAQQWKIAEERLLKLDKLRRMPVTRRFRKLLGALFLDRVILAGAVFFGVIGLLWQVPGWQGWALVVAVLLFFAVCNQWMGYRRLRPPSIRLRSIPRLIRKLLDAPIIVFGHSHSPEVRSLGEKSLYINTGTWASDDDRLAFTHLLVTRQDSSHEVHAELRQWRNGVSVAFADFAGKKS